MMRKSDSGLKKQAAKGIQVLNGNLETEQGRVPVETIGDTGFDEAIDSLIHELGGNQS